MRIIAGAFKGRRFALPPTLKARPTTDFAKESLFNLVYNRVDFEDLDVLDLFSGTGSIGLEFVSRGAATVTCVEQYAPHVQFIRKTADTLNVSNLMLVKGDAYTYIEKCGRTFNLIFADAPYADPRLPEIPQRVFQAGLLRPGGWLIVEHSDKVHFEDHPHWEQTRAYGSVHFSFFHYVPEDSQSLPETGPEA